MAATQKQTAPPIHPPRDHEAEIREAANKAENARRWFLSYLQDFTEAEQLLAQRGDSLAGAVHRYSYALHDLAETHAHHVEDRLETGDHCGSARACMWDASLHRQAIGEHNFVRQLTRDEVLAILPHITNHALRPISGSDQVPLEPEDEHTG